MVCQCDTYKLLCDVKTAAAVPGRVCMEPGSEEDLMESFLEMLGLSRHDPIVRLYVSLPRILLAP